MKRNMLDRLALIGPAGMRKKIRLAPYGPGNFLRRRGLYRMASFVQDRDETARENKDEPQHVCTDQQLK